MLSFKYPCVSQRQQVSEIIFALNRWGLLTAYSNISECEANSKAVDLSSLFSGLTDVTAPNQAVIREILQNMLLPVAENRISVYAAIELFSQISSSSSSQLTQVLTPAESLLPQVKENHGVIAGILLHIATLDSQVSKLRLDYNPIVADELQILTQKLSEKLTSLQHCTATEYKNNASSIIQNCDKIISGKKTFFNDQSKILDEIDSINKSLSVLHEI